MVWTVGFELPGRPVAMVKATDADVEVFVGVPVKLVGPWSRGSHVDTGGEGERCIGFGTRWEVVVGVWLARLKIREAGLGIGTERISACRRETGPAVPGHPRLGLTGLGLTGAARPATRAGCPTSAGLGDWPQ